MVLEGRLMATSLKAGTDKIVVKLQAVPSWVFQEERSRMGEHLKKEDLTDIDTAILKDEAERRKRKDLTAQIPYVEEAPDGYVRVHYEWGMARAIITGTVVSVGPHKAWDGMRAMKAPVEVGDWVVMHIHSVDQTLFARRRADEGWFCITASRNVLASVEVK